MSRLVGKDYLGWLVSWDNGQQEFAKEAKAVRFAQGKIPNNELVTIKKVTYDDSKLWYGWTRGIQTMKNGRVTRNSIQHPNWRNKEKNNPKWKDK